GGGGGGASGREDSGQVDGLGAEGAEFGRGEATVARPGVVAVGARELEYDELVVATGSAPAIPPIEGLDEVEYWTSRDAVWASGVPESLVVLGGGPVGVELAQFFARMGAKVTVVEHGERLLSRVDADAGDLLRERLEEEGVDVLVGEEVRHVERDPQGVRVGLGSGSIDAERVLVATGRAPNVDGLGLEALGVELTRRGVTV